MVQAQPLEQRCVALEECGTRRASGGVQVNDDHVARWMTPSAGDRGSGEPVADRLTDAQMGRSSAEIPRLAVAELRRRYTYALGVLENPRPAASDVRAREHARAVGRSRLSGSTWPRRSTDDDVYRPVPECARSLSETNPRPHEVGERTSASSGQIRCPASSNTGAWTQTPEWRATRHKGSEPGRS